MSTIVAPEIASETLPLEDAAPLWRLSVDQYHAMIDHGILDEDDPVELLEGLLIQKMPKKHPHSKSTRRVRRRLEEALPEGWSAESQEPITLATSEPEPDVIVVRGNLDDYDHHPGPADVAIVIEVADSSLRSDRVVKRPIYARAGIPCYWVIDLQNARIEVYSEPSGNTYARCVIYTAQEKVPVILDGAAIAEIPAASMLP